MAELLIELFSEEIPARMQRQAGADLERLAKAHLDKEGLSFTSLRTLAGPRRLTLVVEGLPLAQENRTEERKGPRANAPEQALAGFLRSTGLERDQLVERDGVLYAQIAKKGRPTREIVAEMVDAIVRGFPWPKSMRWGSGALRWVRPLQRIVCLLDGAIVPLDIDGIVSGDLTEGHRFMGGENGPVAVRDFADYAEKLRSRFVVLEIEERKRLILERARAACDAKGLKLVEDEGLLEEVSGLSEWPTPLLGDMELSFLDLPPEVIRTSMRTHQKYFAVRRPGEDGLAPHFVTVANIEADDGGKAILAGNGKVLSARLKDARFFWDEDRRVKLEDRLEKLKGVTFHAKIGTLYERVSRIEALARRIAPLVGADLERSARAARLAKADLGTGMVGEFPELQGVMGGYYARAEGEAPEVFEAVRDHYRPQGPSDAVPTAASTIAVALADKLDMLGSFFAIDEKPTGSKDPFALRRAALGVIRIILSNRLRLGLKALLPAEQADDLMAFFADRLKVLLREEGKRHDLVDAVFALGDDDLTRVVDKVDALSRFSTTEDGASLLSGYRRAANILKAEEKKGELPGGEPVLLASSAPAEKGLIEALNAAGPRVVAALERDQFELAMVALSGLRSPIDIFFDTVLVNDPDADLRANRLKLLGRLQNVANQVAVFAAING